jgi:beta-glucosidase
MGRRAAAPIAVEGRPSECSVAPRAAAAVGGRRKEERMKHVTRSPRALGAALVLAVAAPVGAGEVDWGLFGDDEVCSSIPALPAPYADWPRIASPVRQDEAVEAEIRKVVAGMTLAEKVGQITQPEIQSITPDEVREYHIGSVLNGGGSWPGNDKHAAPGAWLALADAYWQASMSADARVNIPVIWGIDAVHGNNNVYGATLFPHNIGLGAAHDTCLAKRVAAATAVQLRVTGQDWAFGPTLAVVRDDRWGRSYEGFSEYPAITRRYAEVMVEGMQLRDPKSGGMYGVLATAKHYIGDGGTDQGRDQGVNMSSEADLINLHGQGYYGALRGGVQTVMASFNSWTNDALGIHEGKVHGSRYLITDVLKGKMGFDGLVVSDWNGIGQVAGCTNYRCAQALNAGIDVFMVPSDWKQFIASTIDLVNAGEVPMARIDDAVTRILRVKARAGLFLVKPPSQRPFAGATALLAHRDLAREAVRKSLVLLKNDGGVLPLPRGVRVLVVGKSADSMSNQAGGWTLSWQGTGNTNADFPNGQTILAGIRETVGAANVTFSETADGVDVGAYGAVIAVIGETPYAEGVGDIGRTRTLEHARLHPEDLAVLDKVAGRGVPVVTVFVSGRPLHTNKELNRSDAFVAAWLPGTEGGGVADVLFRRADGKVHHDFQGKLSFSWPRAACQTPLNVGDATYDPLFAYGYGLTYRQQATLGQLDETSPTLGCGQADGGGTAVTDLALYDRGDQAPYFLYFGSPANWWVPVGADPNAVVTSADGNVSVQTVDVAVQGDGKRVTWSGAGQIYSQSSDTADLRGFLNANGALVFDALVAAPPVGTVTMRVDCVWPCLGQVDATRLFQGFTPGVRKTVKIPLQCFAAAGTDFSVVNTPFLVYTDQPFQLSFANVRWSPGAGADADATPCSALVP